MAEIEITFCGMDIDENGRYWLAVPEINLWFDLDNRHRGPKPRGKAKRLRGARNPIRGKVKDGEKGWLLQRRGDKVKVRTKQGKEGWLTFFFIKEFKGEWLKQRKVQRAMERIQSLRSPSNLAELLR